METLVWVFITGILADKCGDMYAWKPRLIGYFDFFRDHRPAMEWIKYRFFVVNAAIPAEVGKLWSKNSNNQFW